MQCFLNFNIDAFPGPLVFLVRTILTRVFTRSSTVLGALLDLCPTTCTFSCSRARLPTGIFDTATFALTFDIVRGSILGALMRT